MLEEKTEQASEEVRQPSFVQVFNRLDELINRQYQLANRALEKSVKIANTRRQYNENKMPDREESVIGILNSLMDRMERTDEILRMVVEDLEEAIN